MTDPLIKLYAGLTDTERGKMAYAYLLQGNELELMRIESTMPEQYFVGLPMAYRRMHVDLTNLTLIYAVADWQQGALCQALMSAVMALLQDDDPEAYKPLAMRFKAAEAVLLAIEQAFDSVCAEHGLNCDLMRGMAGKRFYECASSDLQPDDDSMVGYREIFASALV
jgi:hypothetical protein